MTAPNIVLGSGKLYWGPEDADGNLTGAEILLAETPGITLGVSPNSVQVFSADTTSEELIEDITTRIDRNFAFSTRDITDDALALFAIGAKATVTQTASAVTGEAIGSLKKGAWFQLGRSINPAGVRGVTGVTIKRGSTPLVLDTDYTLDAAMGRIYILPGTAIAENTALTADFTPTANSRTQVVSEAATSKSGSLRFVADNTAGVNRDVYFPRVTLTPNGTLGLKSRSEAQALGFDAKAKIRTLADGTVLEAAYIDGRPA